MPGLLRKIAEKIHPMTEATCKSWWTERKEEYYTGKLALRLDGRLHAKGLYGNLAI